MISLGITRYFKLFFHTVLRKLITLVVIATGQTSHLPRFLHLPSSGVAYSTWLEQLLKYQLGVWGAP